MNIIFVQARLPCQCCFSRTFVNCRAFDIGNPLKEENRDAVCMVKELPFSPETIDLAFGKRLLSHICFRTIEMIS